MSKLSTSKPSEMVHFLPIFLHVLVQLFPLFLCRCDEAGRTTLYITFLAYHISPCHYKLLEYFISYLLLIIPPSKYSKVIPR